MNTKANSWQVNKRLNQIRLVSCVAKYVTLGFLAFCGIIFLSVVFTNIPNPSVLLGFSKVSSRVILQAHDDWTLFRFGLGFCFYATLCIWYWKLSRLFSFYEQGIIFSAEPIRCLKLLGALFYIGSVFKTFLQMLPLPPLLSLPPGITVSQTYVYHLNFFQCDFGMGVDFGALLAGATIVLIAWIMDEGRKIQEEQELTV